MIRQNKKNMSGSGDPPTLIFHPTLNVVFLHLKPICFLFLNMQENS